MSANAATFYSFDKWVANPTAHLHCNKLHANGLSDCNRTVGNFYDSIGYEHFAEEFQYQWEITGAESFSVPCSRDERKIHIRMRTAGHTFSYEWLSHIGGSTKTGKNGYAGKYGEGFKIALLCLMKLGGNAVMSSGRWKLRPCEYMEKIEHQKIQMFGYRMEEREDDGFTTLDLYGIPASDKNQSYAGEALLEFFFPENELLGDEIEVTKDYALYGRSDMAVPCTECENIQGVFYYKYIARGRLPFPAVVHMPCAFPGFDSDRSRKILSEATVVDTVYRLAELVETKAERIFSKEGKKRHLKYHVKEAVLDPGDLEAETKFEKTLLKYISACMHMYGTEKSVRSNAMLTYAGGILYEFRSEIRRYAVRWERSENGWK